MKTQLAQNVRERLAIISDDITKIVGQSCVPCKPLCCPPTLLTLPLKIRVPPANATHLYIIILQLLNILITSYGKYQILPNPHNTAQFNHAHPATAQFNHVCPATAQFKLCMPCYSTVQLCMPCYSTVQLCMPCCSTVQLCMPCYSTVQTMHALLQHSSTHVHYFLLHVSHSDLISKEFINGVTVFNFLISPLKLQL